MENLYTLARRAKDENNSADAANYYSQIAVEEPNSWEAQFYKVLFTCKQTKIAYMGDSCIKLGNCLKNVYSLIDSTIEDESEKTKTYEEVFLECFLYVDMITSNINSNADSYSGQSCIDFIRKHYSGVYILCFRLGQASESVGMNTYAAKAYRMSLKTADTANADSGEINAIQQKLKAVDPSYQPPQTQTQSSSGGCYVATAVYGSYDCPQVWTLRRYRDYTLSQTWYGRAFIRTYYAISPTLVKWFGHTNWFRNLWKPKLDRMVRRLNNEGVSDTPYQDKKW